MDKLTDEIVLAINKIILLGVVAELVTLEIKDGTRNDLKQRVNRLAASARSIQSYFENNCGANKYRETFRKEFLSGKIVLVSEILSLLTPMSEDGVEEVLNAIKEVVENPEKSLAV